MYKRKDEVPVVVMLTIIGVNTHYYTYLSINTMYLLIKNSFLTYVP